MSKQCISLIVFSLVFTVAGFVCQVCLAQETCALVGKVEDASGALVPGAQVEAEHAASGRVYRAITTATGDYTITDMISGTYEVRISRAGFKAFLAPNVEVPLGRRVRVDARLEVGAVTQSVEVKGLVPMLHTESPENSQLITTTDLEDLPTRNGSGILRDFSDYTGLIAGVSPAHQSTDVSGNHELVEGHRNSDNTVYVDGTEIEDVNGALWAYPNLDALVGVEMKAGLYDAEYGKRPGGTLITMTRSGTNQLHGTAFDSLRNNHLNARNAFQPGPNPQYKLNTFGATVGGPIYCPSLFNGKDKAWFFFSYQGGRQRAFSPLTGLVPTVNQRQGIFTSPITDPTTGQPFPSNTIPANRISPIATKLMSFWPAPNTVASYNFTSLSTANPENDDQYLARVDVNTSPNNRWYGRILRDYEWYYSLNALSTFDALQAIGVWSGAFNNTRVIKSNLVNEFFVSMYRRPYFPGLTVSNPGYGPTLGIANFPQQAIDYSGVPDVSVAGYLPLGDFSYAGPVVPGNWQAKESVSFVKGAHSFKAGYEWVHIFNNFNLPYRAAITFDPHYTGNALASFLLGIPYSSAEGGVVERLNTRQNAHNFFFQDHWRAAKKLTLDLGLRYEYYGAWKDRAGYSGNWSPVTGQLSTPYEPLGVLQTWQTGRFEPNVPYVTYINHTVYPRVGIAYLLTPKTVVRAGYGAFGGQLTGPLGGEGQNPLPNLVRETFQGAVSQPTIALATAFSGTALSPGVPAYNGVQTPLKLYNTQSYGLSVERQLGSNMLVKAAYIGSNSVHGTASTQINDAVPGTAPLQSRRPYPALLGVSFIMSNGQNNVQGLELTFERKPTKGLSFLASYTWVKSIDTYGSQLGAPGDPPIESPYNVARKQDRGQGSASVPGRFVLSGVYEFPAGRDKAYLRSGPLAAILGGWSVSEVFQWNDGPYATVSFPYDFVGVGSNADQRPNLIGNPNVGAPHTIRQWFNKSAFAYPAAGTYGNAGRGIVQVPGIVILDADLIRSFRVSEGKRLEFRVEAYNLINHTNFLFPDLSVSDSTFGAIGAAQNPRQLQFGLNFIF